MQKREAFLGKKVDGELAKAKECSKKKDKRGALMALKRKKLYEKVRCLAGQPLSRAASSLTPAWRLAFNRRSRSCRTPSFSWSSR